MHEQWLLELKTLSQQSTTTRQFSHALLEWQKSNLTPTYIEALGDALALVGVIGRSEILDEINEASLADPTIGAVTFKEAQEFFRQKVSMPSKVWTDTLHQAHDRAFVIAGADSVTLVENLRKALDKAINGGSGLAGFRKQFDDIVLREGWLYNGGRNWRTRVIYDTNLRTAHMAGRLKQMRDPDVIKLRPYWQYVHGETREPKMPRDEHLAWNGKVFRHDDPIWEMIYPPNGWKCSCGVVTVSEAGLKRLGKTKPDTAPKLKMRKVQDKTTGDWIDVPKGIDFGWGYQPGHTWERGLVPREWQKPLSLFEPELPLPVSPSLLELGRPFATGQLPIGKGPEFYAGKFLARFGVKIGQAKIFRDKAGQAIIISDALFRAYSGEWKVKKFGRETDLERMAEAIFDPDEIWLDWGELPDGTVRLIRRYLRWGTDATIFSMFEFSAQGWNGVTSFSPRRKKKPDVNYLEKHRRGALIYRR